MDSLPPSRALLPHDQRIRQSQIRDKLRGLHSTATLPVDRLYMAGELERPGWDAAHLFREDRVALVEARSRGHVRKHAADAKPRKAGFSMRQIELERALLCERQMTVECFTWALVLIGETQGEVEPEQARRTCWELRQMYEGGHGSMRWKDGRLR
jgi:hypothetical protein